MRVVVLIAFALTLNSCQLLTNFVRPLVDDPIDAEMPDAGTEAEDTGTH